MIHFFLWLLLAQFLPFPGPVNSVGSTGPALIQTCSTQGSSGGTGTLTCTLSQPSGAGNLIDAFIVTDSGTVTSVSDSGSQTYVDQLTCNSCGGLGGFVIYHKLSTASGITSVTASGMSTFTQVRIMVREYSGVTAVDMSAGPSFSGSSPWASATVTTSQTDLAIGLAMSNSGSATMAVTGSWAHGATSPSGGNFTAFMEDILSQTAATFGATGTSSASPIISYVETFH